MTRLPMPGSDDGVWGNLLNAFLQVEHNADGSLKRGGDIDAAKSTAQTAKQTADDAKTLAQQALGNTPPVTSVAGSTGDVTGAQIAADAGLQSALNAMYAALNSPAFTGAPTINGLPIATAPVVRITTTGATFNPTVQLVSGSSATVTWRLEETGQTYSGLNPTINFGSAATRHVQMIVMSGGSLCFGDVETFNVGFNHNDDAGQYNMGASYDKAAQAVTRIENTNLMTGLVRFAAANTTLAGALNFSGCSLLQYVECAFSHVQSVDVTGCTSMIRLCFEQNNLTYLDLNPVAANLRDVRAAAQAGGTLTMAPLTQPMAQLYHYCIRDQIVVNEATAAQLPVVRERWIWNTHQSGTLSSNSTAINSLIANGNQYTAANLANQFPAGRNAYVDIHNCQMTSVDITNCSGIASLLLNGNGLDQSAVDGVLAEVNSWGTHNGTLDLTGTNTPSAAGLLNVASLQGRGWTVHIDNPPTGVNFDDFERADATGIANVGNSWYGLNGADANIVGGNLVRTDGGAYRILINPGNGSLTADYTVTAIIPAATIGAFIGLVGRWKGGNGVSAFLNGSGTDLRICEAANYLQNQATLTTLNAIPASWTSGTGDHTFAMRMAGSTITVTLDGVDVAQATVATNALAASTGYGICGEGNGRAWHSIGAA